MNLACQQSNLKRGLATVSHAVAGKSALPILSHVLLATDQGRLKLQATNLELGITTWVGATSTHEGSVTLPAKMVGDLIGGLPNNQVTLALNPTSMSVGVACGRFTNNLKGIEAEEFPLVPSIAGQTPIATLPVEVLRETIAQVAFAAANNDARPVLTGVLIRLRDTAATFAATDGFRLATRTLPLPTPMAQPQAFVVPARSLVELARVLDDSVGEVAITGSAQGGHLLFSTESVEVVSRLIDGAYPDFARVIPADATCCGIFDRKELLQAVKLAALFAHASQQIVKLVLEPGTDGGTGRLVLSANAAEIGDTTGAVHGAISGDGGAIALNAQFLLDALGAISTTDVALALQTARSPAVLTPVGQEGHIQLMMPMTLR